MPDDLLVSDALLDFGLVEVAGDSVEFTSLGERYYRARFVLARKAELQEVLSDLLFEQAIPQAFCAALWGSGEVPVAGALSLLRRLRVGDDASGRRWLSLMNSADWIVYNPKHPNVRVSRNTQELVPPETDAARERLRGHLISPDARYGNLLALREMIRAARGWLWWYEQHLPAKALEILYREVDGSVVDEIHLLSGPANIDATAKDDFKRFADEMKRRRGIAAEWRILSKKHSFQHHDRFFLSEGLARNLPPLNTVLAGSTGEILPSDLSREEFAKWWADGAPIGEYELDSDPSKAALA